MAQKTTYIANAQREQVLIKTYIKALNGSK